MRCTLQLRRAAETGAVGRSSSRIYSADGVRYAETAPPADLAADVLCFWRLNLDLGVNAYHQHILPDLTVDIISANGGPPFVMGPPTAGLVLQLEPGSSFEGVRLRLRSTRRLLDCSSQELLDAIVPLDTLLRAQSRLDGTAGSAFCESIAALLRSLRESSGGPDDSTITTALHWLTAHGGSVDQLSHHLGWSSREVRRRFVRSIGVGPKRVQRVIRVQRALGLVRARRGRVSLSEVALECGFADQAHFTRELTELTKLSPRIVRDLARSGEDAPAPHA